MRPLETLREHPHRVEFVAVGGLLAAIVFAGLVGLFLNQRVEYVTNEVLRYDIELETRSNDLRAAVLDLGYSHRNLTVAGPTRGSVDNFEADYETLLSRIESLEELGVRSADAPQPEELRRLAEDYYAGFRPALEGAGSQGFTQASDRGLVELAELERDARELHRLSESGAQTALEKAQTTTDTAQVVLAAVIGGLLAVGAALAYLALRTAGDLRRLYTRETETSENLARSEERFRQMANTVPSFVWTAAPDGSVTFVSEQWYAFSGLTPESPTAEKEAALHPDDAEHRARRWSKAIESKAPYEAELRYRRADGEYRWLLTRAIPVRDSGGEVSGWFGASTDTTDRKQAEEALRESEERYRRTFENAAVGIAHFALDGAFLKANSKLCEMVGYTREELLQTDWMSISHPGELALNLELRERHYRGETESYSLEKRYLHKQGGEVWVNLTASLMRTGAGEPLYYIAFIEDISARRQAEEALRESEERYALAVSGSNDGIWDWNPQTGYDYHSPRWKELLGFDADEELEDRQDTFFSRVHPDDLPRTQEAVRRHLEERKPYSLDLRLRCKSGAYRWFHARGRAMWDEAGRAIRMSGSITDITGRKQAEEALRESEERYRTIVQTANEGVWLVDTEANTLYANEQMAAMLGYTTAEMAAREVTEFCFPGEAEVARQHIASNLRGTFEQFDFRFRREDGSELLVLACTSPVRGGDGSIVGALGMFTDITDRRRSEEALRESEERYRLLFEGNPHPMWVYDLETLAFLAVNEAASRHYGYSPEEFLAMNIEDIRPPEDLPALRRRTAVPVTGTQEAGIWRHRKKDGTVIEVELVTHTFVFGGRHAKLVLAEDITERRRAEEEIRQQARLLDLSHEAILAWELGGDIVYWNRGCEELYGFTKDEAMGQNSHRLLDTVFPVSPQSFEDLLEREGHWEGEVVHTTHEGRIITVESRLRLVQTSGGRRLVLETNRDITRRKRAEEALASSLRSKTDFLADVSHELRTPLTSIRINAEVGLQLQRDCAHVESLEEISRASERMSRLVEDMLFLAHSDSGSPPLEPRQVALAPFLSELCESAEALAGEGGAVFESRISGTGEARLDRERVEQAVLILVSNAVKYGASGGPVILSATTSEAELHLVVEDRGPGIPESDLPRIFDRFYRGEVRRSTTGSGLGLPIARAIAEAHGGRIEAENRSGGGARFSLHFPAPQNQRQRITSGSEDTEHRITGAETG